VIAAPLFAGRRNLTVSQPDSAGVAFGLAGALGTLLLWQIIGWWMSCLAVAGLGLAGAAVVVVGTAEQARSGLHGRGGSSSGLALVLCAFGLVSWYVAGYGHLAAGTRPALAIVALLVTVLVVWAISQVAYVLRVLRDGSIAVGELHRAGDIVDRVEMTAVTLSTAPWAGRPASRRSSRRPVEREGPEGTSADSSPAGALPRILAHTLRGTAWVLAAADASRLAVRWRRVLILLALVPAPGSITRLAGDHWASLAVLALVYVGATGLAQWFFAWEASTSLRFLLPFNEVQTRLALLATPLLVALVLATTAVLCAGLSAWWIGVAWGCALIGIFRRLAAERARTDVGLLVATPMGALPLGLFQRLSAGWDVILTAGVLGFYLPGPVVFQVVVVVGLLYGVWQMFRNRVPNKGTSR